MAADLTVSLSALSEQLSNVSTEPDSAVLKQKNRLEKGTKVYQTLPAFLISLLQSHGEGMDVESIIPFVKQAIHTLRKKTGKRYRNLSIYRLVRSTLKSNRAFEEKHVERKQIWVLNEIEAEQYIHEHMRHDTLRSRRRLLTRFNPVQASDLFMHRVETEGQSQLLRLAKACKQTAQDFELAGMSLGDDLIDIGSADLALKTIGKERMLGICVMYRLLNESKVITDIRICEKRRQMEQQLISITTSLREIENTLFKDINGQV